MKKGKNCGGKSAFVRFSAHAQSIAQKRNDFVEAKPGLRCSWKVHNFTPYNVTNQNVSVSKATFN